MRQVCARLLELTTDVDRGLRRVDRPAELGQRGADDRGVLRAEAIQLGLEQPRAQRLSLDQVKVEDEPGLVVVPVQGLVQLIRDAHCRIPPVDGAPRGAQKVVSSGLSTGYPRGLSLTRRISLTVMAFRVVSPEELEWITR